ncbi:hypothetical protein [Haloferula sp. A504]|uniref:hypothetical protein n=1 Tax=Haloferula sp. A504 TaxID=3373601 RepID=UPI0031C11EDD|nr:hypothetical protein [Verrucomicrobiaceae bacterium E54]
MKQFLLPCLCLLFGTNSLLGGLPQLSEKPWIGWFAGYEEREYRFGIMADGIAALIPLNDRSDEPVSQKHWIEIEPVIEEVLAGGRVVTKQADDTAWEGLTEPTEEGGKMSYRGKVTGGATFEVHFETERGRILAGGRILDKGDLTEHPIRLSIRVKVPNVYQFIEDEEKVEDLADGDRIRLVKADGRKESLDAWEPVWADKDISDPGVRSARIDLEGYDGRKIELEAGDKGLFEFWNGEKRPLYKGFTFGWKPDPAKDPEGKARFVLEFG